tara:strand:- start:600 stop:704 length:105 start_codon:yes stop_codon:yes gene_type:complete
MTPTVLRELIDRWITRKAPMGTIPVREWSFKRKK